jgi:hypothetical protein
LRIPRSLPPTPDQPDAQPFSHSGGFAAVACGLAASCARHWAAYQAGTAPTALFKNSRRDAPDNGLFFMPPHLRHPKPNHKNSGEPPQSLVGHNDPKPWATGLLPGTAAGKLNPP